jgi:hypothetical protein
MVLFAMTTIARLLLIPEVRINKRSRILSIAILFYILYGLRPENIIIYTLILLSIIIADRKPWQNYELISISLAIASISTSLGILIRYSELIINEIAIVRNWRGKGRTAYLDWFIPDTIFEMIAFSWIGAVYFLYSPFPWMIHSILDLPILIEAVVNIVYSCAAVAGIRVISAENSTVAVGFITGIVAGLMMYSLGTVNVGTAVKHRPMFLWAIFLLGGIGISNYIRIHGIKPQS